MMKKLGFALMAFVATAGLFASSVSAASYWNLEGGDFTTSAGNYSSYVKYTLHPNTSPGCETLVRVYEDDSFSDDYVTQFILRGYDSQIVYSGAHEDGANAAAEFYAKIYPGSECHNSHLVQSGG